MTNNVLYLHQGFYNMFYVNPSTLQLRHLHQFSRQTRRVVLLQRPSTIAKQKEMKSLDDHANPGNGHQQFRLAKPTHNHESGFLTGASWGSLEESQKAEPSIWQGTKSGVWALKPLGTSIIQQGRHPPPSDRYLFICTSHFFIVCPLTIRLVLVKSAENVAFWIVSECRHWWPGAVESDRLFVACDPCLFNFPSLVMKMGVGLFVSTKALCILGCNNG